MSFWLKELKVKSFDDQMTFLFFKEEAYKQSYGDPMLFAQRAPWLGKRLKCPFSYEGSKSMIWRLDDVFISKISFTRSF